MLGRVNARNTGVQGLKREDIIPMTLILVRIDKESSTTTSISMKMRIKWD